MSSKKIVINLPDSGITPSIMKGINKRISMMEDFVRNNKKKKKSAEVKALKKEIRDISKLKHTIEDRKIKKVEQKTSYIADALSALGKIRIPSPS